MPSEPLQRFLEEGQRSGLFSGATAQELLAQVITDSAVTVDEIAARMIEKKVLTPYQAEQLLAGHGAECLIAGRYRVVEKLGEGGMGTVFKAHDSKLDRLVAIKVLPAARLQDAAAIARFQREAKALARLSHPHIIQAHDSGEDNGRHFLVMEYVDGATLEKVLRQHGALPPTVAADFLHQAALGLAHAHDKGLIHRDLKPANLLVAGLMRQASALPSVAETVEYKETPAPAGWKAGPVIVKILDLGLARFLQDQLGDAHVTQEGMGLGTPDYMAPEQFRDALHADARTDIYGLGCTLYHLIAGQVPFPGSSYAEKAQAHAKKEPIPLEERCPEMPGGLAFVVGKMMAKHPAERYRTAGEVAEALAPYVADGSHSMIRLRETGTWQGGQPTMARPSRVKRVLAWGGGLVATVVFLGLLVIAWPSLFGTRADLSPNTAPQSISPATKPGAPPKSQVVTIDNGLTVAQDGSGQFKTIRAALEKVKPGQTIRVLDDAVYRETLAIGSRNQHGITLEGVRRPTIEVVESGAGLLIAGAPNITVRGLRFRASAPKINMIHTRGLCPGLNLDNLEMDRSPGGDYIGVGIMNMNHSSADPPIIIRRCLLRYPKFGIEVRGIENDYKTPSRCARILVQDNVISDPTVYGILLRGFVKQVHIVGNRLWGTTTGSALQMDMIKEGSGEILFANNTVHECRPAFRLWDPAAKITSVEFRNNLLLGADEGDMLFLDRRDGDFAYAGPADGTLIPKLWRFGENWREVKKPGDSGLARAWIPGGNSDVLKDRIDVLSREPDNPNFLRPDKNSPLAKGGAGGDLPTYVGAVPPEGITAWDWQKTWDSRNPKMLLTVSTDPKDGGDFRTIKKALAKVTRPAMTIRVLDDATYNEALSIRNRSSHAGLILEAPKHATLTLPAASKLNVVIVDVPRVQVRGFRLRGARPQTWGIVVSGHSPGVLLEDLDFSGQDLESLAVTVESLRLSSQDEPLTMRACTASGYGAAVEMVGKIFSSRQPQPTGGILVHSCKFADNQRVFRFTGVVHDVAVLGNILWNCSSEGFVFDDLMPGSDRILIAHNSLLNPHHSLVINDPLARTRDVIFQSNVILTERGPDMTFLGKDSKSYAGWVIGHNWREVTVPQKPGPEWMLSPKDKIVDKLSLLSRDPSHPDFLRPPAKSPLAAAAAGKDDPSLPRYVGAVPPKGVASWNWDKTWKARTRKVEPSGGKNGGKK